MSINVKKLNDGVTKIMWKTVVSDSEPKNDRRVQVRSSWFKLERVHCDAANAVQLRLEQFEEDDSSNNAQKALRFHFILKLITPGGNEIDEESGQHCSALPEAVRVSINEGSIQMATNKMDEKWCTWQSVNISCFLSVFVCVVF
jgi:hypothetical protein